MATLKTMQVYADKCAERLDIETAPVLRWQTADCKLHRNYAHCHIRDGEYPKGTICLSRRCIPQMTIKRWHHTIAHEVTHLAVKSNHSTATFARRMVALGVANYYDKDTIKRERYFRKLHKMGARIR